MNDQNSDTISQHDANTTYDLAEQARKAVEIHRQLHEAEDVSSSVFQRQMVLRVEVAGAHTPLMLVPHEETVLGRRDPVGDYVPEIDLTPFGAYQMGVSRQHAVIRRDDERLYLIDLSSRNGTFINEKRLAPNDPTLLRTGDEIRLGKITLRIQYKQNPESAG